MDVDEIVDLLGKGLGGLLGIEVVEVTADRTEIALDVTPDLHQPHGIVHGGVHCALVETAASVAASAWYGDRGRVVGVNNHTDFLRPVREGRLTALATPIHRGRTQQLWLVEVTDQDDRLMSRGQVRLQNLPG